MRSADQGPAEPRSPYANTSEVSPEDSVLLESATGELEPAQEDHSSVVDDEIRDKSGGAVPASDVTDVRLSGGGAVETDDGLDELAELARSTAEDIRDEAASDDEPVFDRAERL